MYSLSPLQAQYNHHVGFSRYGDVQFSGLANRKQQIAEQQQADTQQAAADQLIKQQQADKALLEKAQSHEVQETLARLVFPSKGEKVEAITLAEVMEGLKSVNYRSFGTPSEDVLKPFKDFLDSFCTSDHEKTHVKGVLDRYASTSPLLEKLTVPFSSPVGPENIFEGSLIGYRPTALGLKALEIYQANQKK